MQAKCCLELSKTYLEIIMEYYALPKYLLNSDNNNTKCSDPILKWLGTKIFNNYDSRPIIEIIQHCLDEIYHPLYTALSLSKSQTKDINLLIESYISLGEFEFLKDNKSQTSKNFWKQSKISFFSTYKDSDDWIFLRRIDRHSRLQIFKLFKRILRLLICYDNKFIANNVEIFVSYISLETFMIAQKDIIIHQKIIPKPRKKSIIHLQPNNNNNLNNNKGTDFSRYNSSAIYVKKQKQNNSKKNNNNNNNNNDELKKEERERLIIKNPTVTFRIDDTQNEQLKQIQLGRDINIIRPLYQRYKNYNKDCIMDSEKYLDELFRMHWKMRTESSQFSTNRSTTEIDNNKSLVTICKCIEKLKTFIGNDISSTLNRKYRCWKINETFIISLDSVIFIFHTHTLFKYGINKLKYGNNIQPKYHSSFKKFQKILTNIAFHDSDYLLLDDNPWVNKSNSNISFKNVLNEEKKQNRNKQNKKHSLNNNNSKLLLSELSLPYLKLESVKELLMCLDPQNILSLLGAMFSECQIIIISKERCRCLAIMDALFVLMYPFSWQYIVIPWLSIYCFELLNLPIPYIFGIANISELNQIISSNKYDICNRVVIIDLDTNNVIKPTNLELKPNQLPMKIKSKLTRAMFRLMSGFLKNAFKNNSNYVFPPRRRDNIQKMSYIYNNTNKICLLKSATTCPISSCSERKHWYALKN
eukprot:434526_1